MQSEAEPPETESSTSLTAANDLPLEVPLKHADGEDTPARKRVFPRLVFLPLTLLVLFTGAVVGIYIQPPALKAFMKLTGLIPGGGTESPIAVPPPEDRSAEASDPAKIRAVVALGRLVPKGDVVTVAMPYGAGDARIESLDVEVGQVVSRGDTLAVLDSATPLQSIVKASEANVALKEAALDQTRSGVGASRKETRAALSRAKETEKAARRDLARTQTLFEQRVASQEELDQAATKARESKRDVEKAAATVSRYRSSKHDGQPDVVVAVRSLEAARADLNRARSDLARGMVTAPVAGTVLDIHVRPGEKPTSQGVIDLGDTARMMAKLEVYQAEIGRVAVGQPVQLTSDALKRPLTGLVGSIGYSVGRQTQLGSDPAANTDARVIEVEVILDPESSMRSARLVNLEVVARIAVEEP